MRKVRSVAALLAGLIISAASLAEEPLGRLFFSPAQRSILDAGKFLATPAPVVPVVPAARTVHLNGVVTRSDAESTVWINGTAYHNASPDGVQVKTDRAAPASTAIRVPGKAATRRVKVGQRLDLNSGRIQEDFARRPATTENVGAPLESPASRPVIAKKSRAADDAAPLIREAEKPAKKNEGAASDNGKDAPAAAR
jgi:hypothetical protein